MRVIQKIVEVLVPCLAVLCIASSSQAQGIGPGTLNVTPRIATNFMCTAALKSDGSLWAWGSNAYGQLGDGTTTDRHVPTQIGTGYTAIAVGLWHTVALKFDGSLWAWGDNEAGQLGDGTTNDSLVPKKIGTGYSAIGAGAGYTVALKPDGSLWAWGFNGWGQLGDGTTTDSHVPKQIGTGYTSIAAGLGHVLALQSDGSLWTWGWNSYGQLGDGTTVDRHAPRQIGTDYASIAAGMFDTVALKSDGSLWAWGFNASGGLGDGTTTASSVPKRIGAGYTAIAAGAGHTVALKADGSLWAWGSNWSGELGDGTAAESHVPKEIGTGYTAVAAGTIATGTSGKDYTVALKSDGSLWAWGANSSGQLGDGTVTDSHVPKRIDIGYAAADTIAPSVPAGLTATASGPTQVKLSWTASTDNAGVAWYQVFRDGALIGSPRVTNYSDIGLAASTAYNYSVAACDAAYNCSAPSNAMTALTPVAAVDTVAPAVPTGLIATPAGATQVYLSWTASSDNVGVVAYTVYRNGISVGNSSLNHYGDTGLVAATTYSYTVAACDAAGNCSAPSVAVPATTGTVMTVTPRIAAGLEHSLAIKSDGSLWGWGNGRAGQLGNGATTDSTVPKPIGTGYTAIAAGGVHSIALKADGTLWAWGFDGYGELGDGAGVGTMTQSNLPEKIGSGYKSIAAGYGHTVAVKLDGSLWAWGWNQYGQLGDDTLTDSHAPKQIGVGYTLVAAGGAHTLGLKADGSLWAWGRNNYGQLGAGIADSLLPEQIGTGYSAIAAGGLHSVALKPDGSLWAWGNNQYGELGDGTTTSSYQPKKIGIGFSAIAAGSFHTVALKSDGSLWAWGSNQYSQLGDGTTVDSHVPKQIGTGYTAIAAGTGHTLALKAEGTMQAWGTNGNGELGDGTFANRLTPVLISNETGDGPLELIPGAAHNVPANEMPPFWVVASSNGLTGNTSASLSTNTKFSSADIGKPGTIYVTAMVPMGTLGANQPTATASRKSQATTRSTATSSGFVLVQLTASGWQPVTNGQLIPYATGVLGDQLAAQTILNGTDTTSLQGSAFCVGYGTGAAEMAGQGRLRDVATIPLDQNSTGTAAPSCTTVTAMQPANCLFNWAEMNYAALLTPLGAESQTVLPYYYRYYSQSNAYLGVSSDSSHLYYLGPASANSLLDLGAVSSWYRTAGCS